jgi:hypothetical protein
MESNPLLLVLSLNAYTSVGLEMDIDGPSTLRPRASFRALLLTTNIDDEFSGARLRKVTGLGQVGIYGQVSSMGARDVYLLDEEDLDVVTRCDIHDRAVRFIR